MIAESHSPSTAIARTGSFPAASLSVAHLKTADFQPVRDIEVLDVETLQERYLDLRKQSERLIEQGRLEEALRFRRLAFEVAVEIGDQELVALARCNVASVAFSLGQVDPHLQDLRGVLMRNFAASTSFAAAYNLSHAYELVKEYKKSLFYSRIARDRALAAADPSLLAKSCNQIGNGLVGESHFHQAVHQYQEALMHMERGLNSLSVPPRISCGYCLIVLGQVHEGMAQLFECLRWMKRRNSLPMFQAWAHLFLCCGYFELGRVRQAWIHGLKARDAAEETGDYGAIKSSLFMLGEVERCAGDIEASQEWFNEMQRRFYPDNPEMPRLLSQVGMTRVVNLRA